MDIRKIKKLIEMLQESDLSEIEVSQGEESVRISRGNNNSIAVNNQPGNATIEKVIETQAKITGHEIKSPIVGTFYRKPNPEKPPFINVGDIIEKGDVICIVEAMKMMNEIKSEFDGKITSIDVEDGSPVEFGQKIITVN